MARGEDWELGSGGSWTSHDRVVVHFGSPAGTQFGSEEQETLESFQRKHPDFIINMKEEQ